MKTNNLLMLISICIIVSCTNRTKQSVADVSVTRQQLIDYEKINDIIEDANGYIWFATSGGVFQYNGEIFYQYRSTVDTTSLCNDAALQFYLSKKGQLYVLTEFGTSVYNNDGSFRTVFKEGEYPYSHDIDETGDGRVFLSVADNGTSIYEYTPSTNAHIKRMAGFSMDIDMNNRLWVWHTGEICCYSTTDFSRVKGIPVDGQLYTSCLIPNGLLAYFTSLGVVFVNTSTLDIEKNVSTSRVVTKLQGKRINRAKRYDNTSMILFGDDGKLYWFDVSGMNVIAQNEAGFPFACDVDDITSVLKDSHGNIWIGTKLNGYKVIYNKEKRFQTNNDVAQYFQGKDITHVARGVKGDYYVIVAHKQLFRVTNGNFTQPIVTDIASGRGGMDQIFVDSKGFVWLITNTSLLKCTPNGNMLTLVKEFPHHCYTVGEDAQGNIWFETNQTLCCLFFGEDSPTKVKENVGLVNVIRQVDAQRILVSAYAGNLYLVNTVNMQIDELTIPRTRNTGLSCTDFIIDKNHNAWGVSHGLGLLHINLENKQIKTINSDDICPQMNSIVEDNVGNLWIGTLNGLIRFDPEKKHFLAYHSEDGTGNDTYAPMSAVAGWSGDVLMGGTKGLTVFNPTEIKPSERSNIHLEYVASNEELYKGGDKNRLKFVGDSITDVYLPYNNNGVYFFYSTLDFGHFNKQKVEFMLDGVDDKWNSIENASYAYYSHIGSGSYLLNLIALNENGDEICRRKVNVHVVPVPWAQPWLVFGFYPLLTIVLFYVVWRILRCMRANREQIKRVTMQREQEKYASMMNMKYFTNISHEFRTPLTMIYGATRMLRGSESDGETGNLLNIISQNANRMLKLVNQILDFNKMENGILKLKVTEVDAVPVLNNTINRFAVGFKQKQISVQCFTQDSEMLMPLDVDKFDKILTNLVSNALKYSPEESSIKIDMAFVDKTSVETLFADSSGIDSDSWLKVVVADTGIGIPKDKQKAVFERFYQIEHSTRQSTWGTGIGLFYTQQLVNLHYGFIKCESNTPKGTVFTFVLPQNIELYKDFIDNTNESPMDDIIDDSTPPELAISETSVTQLTDEEGKPKILVIDDDTHVLNFMKLLLKDYNVECRTNPIITINEIGDIKPDLIISDVLMTDIDGFEVCNRIKSDPTTCHLPVILLTAYSLPEHQLQGVNAGADAYVVKPFSPDYLLALIKNILSNRRKIRQMLTSSTQITTEEKPMLQSQDGEFIEKFYEYMKSHMTEAEIDIDEILDIFSISRSKFYYKVKDLTGLSPNAFFRTYKLNKAAEMIKNSDEKLTYIADITGFCSQAYFTASFKKQFGCSPSKYREANRI